MRAGRLCYEEEGRISGGGVLVEFVRRLLQNEFSRRVLLLLAVVLLLWAAQGLLPLFLLTFIFIYLINAAQKFIGRLIGRVLHVDSSIIVVAIYLIVLTLIVLLVYFNARKVVDQATALSYVIADYIDRLSGGRIATQNPLLSRLLGYFSGDNLSGYATMAKDYAKGLIGAVGSMSFDFFMALILSLFFMLGKKRIYAFFRRFEHSRLSWFYGDAKYFVVKFTDSFGKVIETQILISLINSVLSVAIFFLLRFPNPLGLWAMVFLLGLVPVAGVFISLVPLSVIAYNVGGLRCVVYILLLVAVLHAIESYVLNPKLMSQRTKLPVFITFLILIVSEHFFGIWGLITGIPTVIFLLDLLDVKPPVRDPVPEERN